MDVYDVAKVCHEVNKAYCESIGDMSQKSWFGAPEFARVSAVNGVKFHIANPKATPAESHIEWLREKISTGWVYGTEKDEIKKTHPCCVEYNLLPQYQRSKDYIFKQVVESLKGFVK